MHAKGLICIESNERFLLLKLVNGLYGISLVENALNTQMFLSKVIRFLKYYTSEEFKLVKLKEELDILSLMVELITTVSGNHYSVTMDVDDKELLDVYIPSKSLLLLMMEIFESTKDIKDEAEGVLMHVYQKDGAVAISIKDANTRELNRIRVMVDELKKSFAVFSDSIINMESDCSAIIIKAKT